MSAIIFAMTMDFEFRKKISKLITGSFLSGFLLVLLSGCVSTGSKGSPNQNDFYLSREEYKGINLYQEVPPQVNYTVLGYLRITSHDSYLSESLLEQMLAKTVALKGNGLIELQRMTKLETSNKTLHVTRKESLFEEMDNAVFDSYYEWTATIVILP